MSSPTVSIILPTYNGSKYLQHSIQSCLDQTYRDFELIVVDDCSKDRSPEIVMSFKDPRIRYIRNQQNQRLPRSLNIGFAQAKGKYLTWTSDDNFFLPQALERMVKCLEENQGNFVYCDLYIFYNDNANDAKKVSLPDPQELKGGNCVRACFMYTRKVLETIGDYDPDMELLEDYDYWVRIYKKFPMLHIKEPLYYYRHHAQSLWTSRNAEIRVAELLFKLKHGFADVPGTVWRLVNHSVKRQDGFRFLYKMRARVLIQNRINTIVKHFYEQKINFTQARLELNAIINPK